MKKYFEVMFKVNMQNIAIKKAIMQSIIVFTILSTSVIVGRFDLGLTALLGSFSHIYIINGSYLSRIRKVITVSIMWGPERLVGICIDKGYKFPLNQCFKAYLFFIFNSLKCLGIDNKSNLYSPRKVICSQLIGDTCFIYLVTSGSILTR